MDHLKLMYVTNNPQIALIAQNVGIDRIWIDMEVDGKEERQKNMNTLKSSHTVEDVKKIAPLLSKSELLVRINPWSKKAKEEVNQVVQFGADMIMLPMWKTVKEVEQFIKEVDSRAKTLLLLETKEAVECLDDVLKLNGIDEIHIGINDLHLSYGLNFLFEPLVNGMVEDICKKINLYDIPYGFGGFGRLNEGLLPAKHIIGEHYRLGSKMAILSRGFFNIKQDSSIDVIERSFEIGIKEIRLYEDELKEKTTEFFLSNQEMVKREVYEIVRVLGKR